MVNIIERRSFDRFDCVVMGLAFVDGNEINFDIKDISEYGIRMELKTEDGKYFNVNDAFILQFSDKYFVVHKERNDVLIVKALVRYVNYLENKVYVGCYINNPHFVDYVFRRKFVDYYNKHI